MSYISFDQSKEFDLLLLGRVTIDFNPAYNDQVKEEFKPLKNVHMFEKFVGGSPANISVGVTKHGLISRIRSRSFHPMLDHNDFCTAATPKSSAFII